MLAFKEESFLAIASGVLPSAACAVEGDGQPVKSNTKSGITTTDGIFRCILVLISHIPCSMPFTLLVLHPFLNTTLKYA